MPRIPDAEREEFSSRARSLFISKATIAWFLETATPGQLAACSGMLARELESRERSKRARLLRQARFPVPKAVEGFDWSNVRFPEGWGRDEMLVYSQDIIDKFCILISTLSARPAAFRFSAA